MIYNCKPIGGISNRLKWLTSALVYHNQIYLDWEVSDNKGGPGPGVGAEFNKLFVNTYCQEPGEGEINTGSDFTDPSMRWIHTALKNEKMRIKYNKTMASLVPVEEVTNLIKKESKKFTPDTATFSIRTFRCFSQEYKKFGQYFNPKELYQQMDSYKGPIFVTCDDANFLLELQNKYGSKLITTPKRTFFGDNNSTEGMQDILVDLYLGGMNSKIFGTPISTFVQMQWWLGQCKSEFIPLNLHTNIKVPK